MWGMQIPCLSSVCKIIFFSYEKRQVKKIMINASFGSKAQSRHDCCKTVPIEKNLIFSAFGQWVLRYATEEHSISCWTPYCCAYVQHTTWFRGAKTFLCVRRDWKARLKMTGESDKE